MGHAGGHLTQGGQTLLAVQLPVLVGQLLAQKVHLAGQLLVGAFQPLGHLVVGGDDGAQLALAR